MNTSALLNPKFDLSFERIVDITPRQIWKGWTQPQHLMPWFCPLPWKVVECEIDLRPGGLFRTVMQSPEGQNFPNLGCYFEVIENQRLTWTNALLPDFRPAQIDTNDQSDLLHFFFTATIALEPHGSGTHYRAYAASSPWRSRVPEARQHGLPRRLGHRARPTGCVCQRIQTVAARLVDARILCA